MAKQGVRSALLSIVSLFLVGWIDGDWISGTGVFLAPGACFGLIVMIPFRPYVSHWWARMALVMMISAGAHAAAMSLIMEDRILPAGAVGALIVGKGILVVLGRPWRYRVLGQMVLLGGLGIIFVIFAFLGYFLWQPLVAAPLGGLLRELRESGGIPNPIERPMNQPEDRGRTLRVLPGPYAIARLDPDAGIPEWIDGRPDRPSLFSVTITHEELSIVCPEGPVPPDARAERGWRALQVEGPLPFELTGVLASISAPLAEAGISLFAVSTFDTDYLLVPGPMLEPAIEALRAAGHEVNEF